MRGYRRYEGELEGEWLDRIVGLNDVKTAYVFLGMPDGQANLELIKYDRPSDERGIQQLSANTLGIRHIAFVVDDIEAVVAKLKEQGFAHCTPGHTRGGHIYFRG